jgi:hypothetical protein
MIARAVFMPLLIASVVLFGSATLAQDLPDFKVLIGKWTWRPLDAWTSTLTITDVTPDGLVKAEWSDPNRTVPFTTRAQANRGEIKLAFGQPVKYDLTYDKRNDALIGTATGWPPRFTGHQWTAPQFRRTR